jgi:subtilase family serine protease
MRAARTTSWLLATAGICLIWGSSPAGGQAFAPGAVRIAAASPDRQLQLLLPLKADDSGLSRFAQAVSSPGSALYGEYEPVDELGRRFGASAAARVGVVRFLRKHGATGVHVDVTEMFAHATMSVATAQRLFSTTLATFATSSSRFVAPVSAPRVPAGLRGLIDGVVGLDTRPVVTQPAPRLTGGMKNLVAGSLPWAGASASQPSSAYFRASGKPSGCAGAVHSGGFTPNQYRTAYNYDPLRSAGFNGAGERVALMEIDGFKYSDLAAFARCFGMPAPRVRTYRVGLNRTLRPGPEATLDLEALDAAAPDLAAMEVFETRPDDSSVLRAFLTPLLHPGTKPQIISSSIGLCEKYSYAEDGGASIRSAERSYQLLASDGVTVLAAAGDNGSADCTAGESHPSAHDRKLAVDYPASSPWVTGVGGTQLRLNKANRIVKQLVWNDTTELPDSAGGGGLSHLFGRPSYQNGVLQANHRGVPDVAMLADPGPGYAEYCSARDCGGKPYWQTVGGTSAASPLLAGGVALVDEDLRVHGQELLGFLNPLLYSLGKKSAGVFDDVTAYGNDVGPYLRGGGGKPLGCCTAGPGYDLASGWGSIYLGKLDAEARSLLPKVPHISLSLPSHQDPLKSGVLKAVVHCSAACRARSFMLAAIEGGGNFDASSKAIALTGRGQRSVEIRFSWRQRERLRRAVAQRQKVSAEAYGAVIDGHGDVLSLSAGQRVRVGG